MSTVGGGGTRARRLRAGRVSVSQSHQLFPGSATWHALDRQLTNGWHLLRSAPAPAPATNGAILLAVIAVWCMAAIADWLAFRRQATLGAIAPALVFFVWTSTLGTSDARVLGDRRLRRGGGRVPAGAEPRRARPSPELAGVAARRAPALARPRVGARRGRDRVRAARRSGDPGRGRRPAPRRRQRGPRQIRRAQLPPRARAVRRHRRQARRGRQHRSCSRCRRLPDYWRIAALDTYSNDNGGQWTLSAEGDGNVSVGLPAGTPTGTLVQRYDIGPLGERWLPRRVPAGGDRPRRHARGAVVGHDRRRPRRASPTCTTPSRRAPRARRHRHPGAAGGDGRGARRPAPLHRAPRPTSPDRSRPPPQVVTAGATTPYAQAEAPARLLPRPATSSTTPPSGASTTATPSSNFLDDKRGFCVQFASAYAVMARSLGIPARVAVGFTPATPGADGAYHVTSHDAHAWPEIWLAGSGGPTSSTRPPAAGGSIAGGSALPDEAPIATDHGTPTPRPRSRRHRAPGPPAAAAPRPRHRARRRAPDPTCRRPRRTARRARGWWWSWSCWRWCGAGRRLRHRRASAPSARRAPGGGMPTIPRRRVGAWEEALDRLHEAHVAPDPALTPLELARAAPQHTTKAAERPLRRLAGTYTHALRRRGTGPDDARPAWTRSTSSSVRSTADLSAGANAGAAGSTRDLASPAAT